MIFGQLFFSKFAKMMFVENDDLLSFGVYLFLHQKQNIRVQKNWCRKQNIGVPYL
mgnify:CR=1 FL=1